MSNDPAVVQRVPEPWRDLLIAMLRESTRRLIADALKAEVYELLSQIA
jgi:hypothetical protein